MKYFRGFIMRLSSYTKKILLILLLVLGTALPVAATMSVASKILVEKLQLTISVVDSQLAVSAEDKQDAIELWLDADLFATCGDTLHWINQQLFVNGKASDPFESTIQRCLSCLAGNPDGEALLQILPDSVIQWTSTDFQKIAETTEFLALEKQLMACKLYPDLPDVSVSFFTQQLDQLIQKPNPLISLEFLETELREIHWTEGDIRDLMLFFGKIKMHQRIYPLSRECFRNADYLRPGPVLPGLDSTFAARSDSLSRTVLTPSGHRLLAQSLNMLALDLVGLHDSLRTIQQRLEADTATADDSARIPTLITEAYSVCNTPENPDFRPLRKAYRKRHDLRPRDMAFMADQVIKFAVNYLKMASKTDPFSQVYPISLANSVYMQQAQNFADSSKFMPAVAVLEQLTAQQAGNWQLFLLLGNAYLGAKQWNDAIRNYAKARENVEKSAFLLLPVNESRAFSADPDSTPANTEFLLNCYWSQAQAEIMANQGG
ncbi:hypothetical protein KAH55_03580, partial [bacterium]|nr:hypothetical protein [bacterium]